MSVVSGTPLLISTALFPPPRYYALFIHLPEVIVEYHEHYIKQTYRNRYLINANGKPYPLIVPVIKTNGNHTRIDQIEIDYHENWPRNHARALETAYGSSPFFEYLKDDIFELLYLKPRFLIQLNETALVLMKRWLDVNTIVHHSNSFTPVDPENLRDWRYRINPKSALSRNYVPYYQGLNNRIFIPDLSILDLFFNIGPESKSYLHNLSVL